MAIGTEGTSTAEPSTSPSITLGDEIAELMGDFNGTGFDELPEPAPADAGAPPANATAPAPDPTQGSEGAPPDAAHAGATPAVAADAALDANAGDPLDGATPLAYTVDGEARSFDGIKVLKGGGAIVEPDHLPKLQQRLSERDHLYEQGQRTFEKYRDLERATTWQTRDAQGNVKELTGRDALVEQRSVLARSLATLTTLNAVLSDPTQAARLVTPMEDGQGGYTLVWNSDALDSLRDKAKLAAIQAETSARSHFTTASAPPQPAETPVAAVAAQTVDAIAQQHAITGLTAEDKATLAEQLERYVRPTTPEEKANGLGTRIVDASFTKLAQRFASLRTTSAASVSAATNAAQENARRLAAAAQGRRPTAASTPRPAAPAPQSPSSQDDYWDRMERAARR